MCAARQSAAVFCCLINRSGAFCVLWNCLLAVVRRDVIVIVTSVLMIGLHSHGNNVRPFGASNLLSGLKDGDALLKQAGRLSERLHLHCVNLCVLQTSVCP
jgi:hypothetical protein